MFPKLHFPWLFLFVSCLLCGCGSTKTRSATEQLLISDAVDRSIASIDFRALSGRTVYLDTQYVKSVKGLGYANVDYIISSLRQQMLAARCYLEEDPNEAEYIAEVRVGALGTDAHSITYGIPPSASLSSAASLVPNAPAIPMIPEISFAKKESELAAAKIAVFAYHRETHQPFWQSGLAQAKSSAKNTWLFGAGPIQTGSLYNGPQFADGDLAPIDLSNLKGEDDKSLDRLKLYARDYNFAQLPSPQSEGLKPVPQVKPVSHEKPAEKPSDGAKKSGEQQTPKSDAK